MIDIKKDDLSSGDVIVLLEQHRQEMFKHSPPESVHALDIEGLKAPELTFWSARLEGTFAGCGALKELDKGHAEIKSMKTNDSHVRKGVAAALLAHILAEGMARGYTRLSLETGTMDAFIPARRLYEKNGFVECPPFGGYGEDPHSVCMTLSLN